MLESLDLWLSFSALLLLFWTFMKVDGFKAPRALGESAAWLLPTWVPFLAGERLGYLLSKSAELLEDDEPELNSSLLKLDPPVSLCIKLVKFLR